MRLCSKRLTTRLIKMAASSWLIAQFVYLIIFSVVGVPIGPLDEMQAQVEELAENMTQCADNIARREDVIVQCFDSETNTITASTKLLSENNYLVADAPKLLGKFFTFKLITYYYNLDEKDDDRFTRAIKQVHRLYLRELMNLKQLNSELMAGLSGCVLETPDDYYPIGDLGLTKEHF